MATHYISNESSGNQYYFNTANATTSHSYGNYSSPVTSTYGSSTYSAYPGNVASVSNQRIHLNNSYKTPQQYQSVAGFNNSVTQHDYHTTHLSTPQVRATARAVTSQNLYSLQHSPQPTLISPQHHHFQFDTHQQPGRSTGPPVVYQTPGAAQFTHRNVDLWTEGSPSNQDHYVQAQRVSVRSVSTGSPQQSHSVSPQRHQDQLQKYYSQLTPEQHQQLLRNQQLQKQQEQSSHYEQHHHVTAQQVSPSGGHHRSTNGLDGGQHNQQRHVRSDSERQQQSEQDYYAAQRVLAAQRIQQEDPSSHPVGIRSLMNKFTGPAASQPRSKSATTRHYSSSSHTHASGPRQATTNHSYAAHSMTYSSLPKPSEPPVNSVEYYQMQMQKQGGTSFNSVQQAAAPSHIQHAPAGFGAIRDRFTTGSHPDEASQPQVANRQQQHQQQQQQQAASIPSGGNNLSSLRNQYINQAQQSLTEQTPAQQVQKISRTILGEDTPELHQAQHASVYQPPVQQQKPVTPPNPPQQKQTTPQTAPQPQEQQAPSQAAAPQQKQESAVEAPVQQKQKAASETPATPEQESASETSAKQQSQQPTQEAAPSQQQSSVKEAAQQKTEPAADVSSKQPDSSSEAVKQQPSSATQSAKKEPAKTATKPADKK